MTRSLIVDPTSVRVRGVITAPEIPVNVYEPNFKAGLKRHGKQGLIDILHDMIAVHSFETMLDSIKTTSTRNGAKYSHRGPTHLSIGQESAVMGQASQLGADDFVLGSHRSHDEILTKCFSISRKLDDADLEHIMKEFPDGETLFFVGQVSNDGLADVVENFILYDAVAKTFARKAGFNRGLDGFMRAFFTPLGSVPNSTIIGGSADIATGATLFKRISRRAGIVITNIGDAPMGCGPIWESMMLVAMDRYRALWKDSVEGSPPIWFNFFNNFYGMGGQASGETTGYDILARVGMGVSPETIHTERVGGLSPLAVADAVVRKRELLGAGCGPVLTDTITYRFSGCSPSGTSSYRTREEVELWEKHDGLKNYAAYLIKNKVLTQADVNTIQQRFDERLTKVITLVTRDEDLSPHMHMGFVDTMIYNNDTKGKLSGEKPQLLTPLTENPCVKALRDKIRTARGENGKPVSRNKAFTYRDTIFEAVAHRLATDPTLAAWDEEDRDWGGAFAIRHGLTKLLSYHRLFNSPISEAVIVGADVGYTLSGDRALVELMYYDFLGRTDDEIFNQAAKQQAMPAGLLEVSLVIRVSVGNEYGTQYFQNWLALCAHMPDLKVYYPATPYDTKDMMNLALCGTDPVVFFESQLLYDEAEKFQPGGVPEGYYGVSGGEPVVRREGSDLTIAILGATLYRILEAADILQSEYGLSAEVIDLRFVAPLDLNPVIKSVKKAGRLLFSSDTVGRGSFLQDVAFKAQNIAFSHFDAPVTVVGSRNAITPATELEKEFFPQPEWLVDMIHGWILSLPGHVTIGNQTTAELARRTREGL